MQSSLAVALAMLMWGNSAIANPSGVVDNEEQQIQIISAWTAHLNFFYPKLNLRIQSDLQDETQRAKTLYELEFLEESLRVPHRGITKGSLLHLACNRPACDGGGGGDKCNACYSY